MAAVAAVVVALVSVGAAVAVTTGGDDPQPTTTTGSVPDTPASSVTALPPATTEATTLTPPTTLDPEDAALQELEDWVGQDMQRVNSQLVDRWLPQISAKQLGTFDAATDESFPTYVSILNHFQELEQRYTDVVLVHSSDYASFQLDGYYVMLVERPYSTSPEANDWCAGQGLSNYFCYAKMLNQNPDSGATTDHP